MLTSPQNSSAPEMSSSPSAPSLGLSDRLAQNLSDVKQRISAAALRYGRDPRSITLLAVSKQQSMEAISSVAAYGQRDFGENYLQEAIPKTTALSDPAIVWHFIGQLQSNKTRPVAEHFQWVHTIDRLKIAERLNEQRSEKDAPLNVCIQVKLADEVGKGGVPSAEVAGFATAISAMPRLRLRGIMCIPPPRESFDEQLVFFREARVLYEDLKTNGFTVDTLSMGMSADLEAAIAAGATVVRVGAAIFGERKSA